jgi:hypothetical protein
MTLNDNERKKQAELLLLSKFLYPQALDYYKEPSYWDEVLKEPQIKTIERLINNDFITTASLSSVLDYKYCVSELKSMLKERGLKVSGLKADLIKRLVSADPNGVKQITNDQKLFECSEKGRIIAQNCLAEAREKKNKAIKDSQEALKVNFYEEAIKIVSRFESEQVFPRGYNIDWENPDITRDHAIIKYMFTGKPKILKNLNDKLLPDFRIAAAMMFLWGENRIDQWFPSWIDTGLVMDNDTVARMIMFYATHRYDLDQFRCLGKVIVEILPYDSPCDACAKIANKKYKINEMIELPYENCTNELGCRCLPLCEDL